MPNTASASPSARAVGAKAGSTSTTDSSAADATTTLRLPARRHSAPEAIIVAIDPADRPSSARPSTAGEAPTWALTAGTRTAQLAKRNPSRAKNVVTQPRALRSDGAWPAGAPAGGRDGTWRHVRKGRKPASLFSDCTK
jgi:hypothetical protein